MKAIIDILQRRTMDDKLVWEETEEEGFYQIAFPRYAVRVSKRPTKVSGTTGTDYLVSIYNTEGKLIDEVSDLDMQEDYTDSDPYYMMKELYDNARRSAMGVQTALGDILKNLEESGEKEEDSGDRE